MDDLLEFNLRWIDRWTSLEYDGLHFADDWGEQRRLLIRPATWRKLFKPRYKTMFDRVHAAGMDVWYHTDGCITDIFGDLVEIGVDVINCQVVTVGHDWIAQNVRGKVAFRTDIDRQHILPFGSPAQVKEEVHRTFEACGTADGGIVACGEYFLPSGQILGHLVLGHRVPPESGRRTPCATFLQHPTPGAANWR